MGADIKRGDRVRVVIEGEVDAAHDTGKFRVCVGDDGGHAENGSFIWAHPETTTVEKIEPPVEVFKPGDVVRSVGKFPVGNIYALTEDGFVRLAGKGWAAERNGVHVKFPVSEFTSEFYERVTLE